MKQAYSINTFTGGIYNNKALAFTPKAITYLLCFILTIGCYSNLLGQASVVAYTGMGSVTCPAVPTATISPTVTGLTFAQFSRGSGVTCQTVTTGIAGSTFTSASGTAGFTANKYFAMSITANASTPFSLTSISLAGQVSTAGGSYDVQYNINGGGNTSIGTYTTTTTTFTQAFTPTTAINVPASGVLNIYFVPYGHATGTTVRVNNNTSFTVFPGTIALGSITPTSYCGGASISIPYTVTGTYTAGNVFTAQLSNSAGSFASPTSIGTVTSTASGTISGTIPANVATGSGYLIRVVSSNPANVMSGNSSALSLTQGSTATITATPSSICTGQSSSLTSSVTQSLTATQGAGGTVGSSYDALFYHLYGGLKSQFMVKATELTALGFTAGSFTSLGFNINAGTSTVYNGFAVNMANTTNTSMSAGLNTTATYTTVYSAASITPVTGVNTLTFSTPFVWDGTSNVIIQFCWSNNNTGGTSTYAKVDAPGFVSCAYYRADSQTPAVECAATTGTGTTSNRPQFVFTGPKVATVTTYSWSNGSSAASQTVSPASTTNYTLSATVGGCQTVSNTVTVTLAGPLTASAGSNVTICTGASTTLTASGSAGCGGYTYNWGSGFSGTATNTVTPASTTTYTVTVQDANSNTATASVTVTINPLSLNISTNPATPTICGSGNVVLTANASGGTAPLTYTWAPTATLLPLAGNVSIETATPSSTTTYTVTVKDANLCSITASQAVTVVAAVTLTANTSVNPICAGQSTNLTSTAVQTVTATQGAGGTVGSNYDAIFDHVYGGCKSQFMIKASELTTLGFSAGNITALAINISAGTSTSYAGFAISMANTVNTDMSGGINSVATFTSVYSGSVTPATGTNSYTFSTPFTWDGTSNVIIQFCWSNNNTGGTSTWAKVDAPGFVSCAYYRADSQTPATICGGTTASGTTSNRPQFTLTGQKTPTVSSYLWSNGATTASQTVSPVVNTNYTLSATVSGCQFVSNTISETISSALTASAGSNVTICTGASTTLTAAGTSGGCSPYQYDWGSGYSSTATNSVSPASTTTYTVTVQDAATATATAQVTVTINPLSLSITPNPAGASICGTGSVILTANGSGGTAPLTYTWSPTTALQPVGGTAATETATPTSTTTYTVTVKDANNCTATASQAVNVVPGATITASASVNPVCLGNSTTLSSIATIAGNGTLGSGASTTTGSGTSSTNYYSPFTHYYGGYKAQYLITAAELTAQGLVAGNITGLAFNITTAGTSYAGFTINMGTTASTAMTTTFTTVSTQVYSGTVTPTVGTTPFTFSTPFNWDGTSNIIIQICWSNNNGGGTACEAKYDATAGPNPATAYYRVDNTAATTVCAAATATNTLVGRPQIILTGQKATTPSSYLWSSGATTASTTVSPVSNTTYTLSATVSGCQFVSNNLNITLSSALAVSAGSNATICPGTSKVLTAVGSGGCSGYTYDWGSGFSATATTTVSPSSTTTYTVTVQDANSNTATGSVTITVNPAISLNITPTTATICGSGSVAMSANASGGTGTLTYAWSPTTGLTPSAGTSAAETAAPATTTTYTVTVTDANTCTVTASKTVGVSPVTTLTATATPATTCAGGAVSLSATSLGAAQTLQVGTSTTTDYAGIYRTGLSSDTRTQLLFTAAELNAAGIYAGNITSISFNISSGNVGTGSVSNYTIKMGAVLSTTTVLTSNFLVPTFTTCYTAATYTPVTGTNLHTFSTPFNWDGTSNVLIDICYTVVTANGSSLVDVNTPASVRNNSLAGTSGACAASTGTTNTYRPIIKFGYQPSLTATSTYSWNPGSLTGNPVTANPVANTTYNVTGTDANGCTSTGSVGVTMSAALSATPGSNATICAGKSTTLSVTAAGGCGGYTYLWSGGAGSTASVTVSPGTTTTYTVTVTDAGSVTVSTSVSVTVNSTPTVTISPSPANSAICGSGNVVMTANASGGTGTLTYAWAPAVLISPAGANASVETATPTGNTTYTVTVSDANSCTATASNLITVSAGITASATASPSSLCVAGTSQLQATVSGGGTSYSQSSITSNLLTATGTVTTLHAAGVDDATSNITLPFAFNYFGTTIVANSTLSACSNGWLCMSSTTNTSYTSAAFPSTTAPTNIIAFTWADLETGTGTVTSFVNGTAPNRVLVVSFNNCRFHNSGTPGGVANGQIQLYEGTNIIEIHLGTITDPSSAISKVCGIENLGGTKSYTPTGRNYADYVVSNEAWRFTPSTFSYAWSPAGSLSASNIANPVATIAATSSYVVTITDAATTCTATATATVTLDPVTVSAGSNVSICNGQSTTLTATGSAGCPSYQYNWGSGFSATSTSTVSPTSTTTYTVTIQDANSVTATSSVTVTVNPTPSVTIGASPANSAICGTGNVVMTANGSGGTGTLSYTWNPTTNLQPVAGTASIETATPTTSTLYTVTVKDVNNCSATASNNVVVTSAVTVNASATPATLCVPGNSQLQANVTAGGGNYTVSSIPLSLQSSITPTTIHGNSVDDVTANVNIPFAFNYFGTAIPANTALSVCSNGWLCMSSTTNTSRTPAAFPSTTAPTNIIAISWADLYTRTGTITSFTTGSAPNRIFVVSFNNVQFYNSASYGGLVNGQIQLYEGTNVIEIHLASVTDPTGVPISKVCGIENLGGTKAYTPSGRNLADYQVTNEAWRFTPSSFNYNWSPGTFLNSTTIANPLATGVNATSSYNVTATDASTGCSASASTTITLAPVTVSAGSNVSICNGKSTTLTAVGSAGCTPYQYDWGSGFTATATKTVSPTTTTVYTVTIQDANSVTASASVTVTVNSNPTVTITPNPANAVSCAGALVTLTANPTGGNGTYTYAWSPTTNLQPVAGNASVESATPSTSRTYTLTVTDGNTCSATVSQAVTRTALPTTQTVTGANYASCGSGTSTLGLANSQTGVSYQLTQGATNLGSPVAGTGGAITFSGTYPAGSYTIVATNAGGCTRNISVTITTVSTLSGTVTVGTGGTYTTLTGTGGLFDAINNGRLAGDLTATVISNITEPGTVGLNQWSEVDALCANKPTPSYNLTIQSDGTVRTLSGNYSSDALIRFYGADRVTITGGTAAQRLLVFSDAYGSYSTIKYFDDCAGDQINNCEVKNSFASCIASGGSGTASLSVLNNTLHDVNTLSLAYNGFYCGNTGMVATVTGNNIYNFDGTGINIYSGADNCTISGNSIYQLVTGVSDQTGIYVASGGGHTISGNYIGGQAPNGGVAGTPWVNSGDYYIYGINIDYGVGTGYITVTDNVIQNISMTTNGYPYFYGINIGDGNVRVGTSGHGNTIGSTAANLGITLGTTGAEGFFYGIYSTGLDVPISYNTIANIKDNSTSIYDGNVTGIYFENYDGSPVISYNKIYNITSTNQDYYDILSSYSSAYGSILGIKSYSAQGGQSIFNNEIHDFALTTTAAQYVYAAGICMDGGGSGNISNNKIYNFTNAATATSTLPGIAGIRDHSGDWTYYNNMIDFSNGSAGTSGIYGILDGAGSYYYHNSIYIGGTASSGTASSFGFYQTTNTSQLNVNNNIFYNARTGTGKHYAISINSSTTGANVNYNNLYSATAATVGLYNSTDKTFAAWKTASSQDANSKNTQVLFIDPTVTVDNLKLNPASNCQLSNAGLYVGVSDDFEGDVRQTGVAPTNGPDIGADEFTYNAGTTLTLTDNSNSNTSTATGILNICAATSYTASSATLAPATITYAWATPDAYAAGNVASFTRNAAASHTGLYTLSVTDVIGCTTTATATLNVNPQPVFTATGTNVSCNGANDGQIAVNVTVGTSPLQYSLNGGTSYPYSASPITNLSPAAYTVQVKDANGCVGATTIPITITEPAVLTASTITATNVTCNGFANGTISGSASTGGTTPYTYTLNGGSPQATPNYTALGPGTYVVTTTDAHGCTNTSNSVTITQPNTLTVNATNSGPFSITQNVILNSSVNGGTTAYSYSWTGPAAFTSNQPNPVRSNATVAMSGTYNVTVTDANGCTAASSTVVVVNPTITFTWTGAVSTAWNVQGNWNPVPPVGGPNGCSYDVIIPLVANQPVISSAVGVGNIQMYSGTQLTLNADLSVCKNFTGGFGGIGSTSTGTGVVILNGNSVQTINGIIKFNELKLDNPAGAATAQNAAVEIMNAMDLKTGTYNAALGVTTFRSTSTTQVAIIDNFSAGYTGTITGNIKAQRYYIASVSYNQHFMGSPVNAPSFSQLGPSGTAGGIVPTANCDETQVAPGSPYSSVLGFDESRGATCTGAQWIALTAGSGNMVNGKGYAVAKVGAGVLTLTGTANLNTSYSITGCTNSNWTNTTLQGHVVTSGWQLVANPYLASLNITTANAGFDNQIQVWNANGPFAGTYQPGIVGVNAYVAPFQGFMVHKTNPGGTATYTINGTDRSRTQRTFFQANDNELTIVAQNNGNGLLDQTVVAFNSAATDQFDPQYDANKPSGSLSRHTLYSVNNGEWMSRNILHDIAQTSTVPVGFEAGATATYTFNFNGVNTFDPTSYIYLEDKMLGIMHNVRNGDYTFTADSADAWDRFVLHFTPAATFSTTAASCVTQGTINVTQPGTAVWNYTLVDANNATISTGVLNQNNALNVSVAAGNYTLTLVDNNNYTVTQALQVTGAQPVTAQFNASANAVVENQDVVFTSTTANVTNYSWDMGNGQTATGQSINYSYPVPGTYTVALTVTNLSGCTATTAQTITVAAIATGLGNVTNGKPIAIWSNENRIYVDFTGVNKVDAVISIYNVLGQEISNDKYTSNTVYQKEISNIEAAYMIVSVKNEDKLTTKKLFIRNVK